MLKIQKVLLFIELLPHDRSVHLFKTTDDYLDVLVFIELAMFGRKIWQINRCVCVLDDALRQCVCIQSKAIEKFSKKKSKVKFTDISGCNNWPLWEWYISKKILFLKRKKIKEWAKKIGHFGWAKNPANVCLRTAYKQCTPIEI